MLHVYFGDGKGKTTAAVGQGVRAAGWGLRVIMFQFQKTAKSGEIKALKLLDGCPGMSFEVIRPDTVKGFFWNLSDDDKLQLKEDAVKAVEMILDILGRKACDLLILDEILGVIKNGILNDDDLLKIISCAAGGTELVITGREASERILAEADYATEIKCMKHPLQKDVKARKGIEY